ncbi:probable chitinase 3 [Fopius arisanus]|uniref:Probable chitinase 3 n=1 Tax=Fopius arisanus TaxID=64838 RepID=A0A9R1U099_9HYME|nr:PREDICTED: probable chitinase 3 [Fopius arisanus]
MVWPTVALLGLSTLTLVTSYRMPEHHLQPPIDVDSHSYVIPDNQPHLALESSHIPLRDAVEFNPHGDDRKSQRLEDIPQDIPKRIPLRDAVERRPPPPLGNRVVNHESIWLEQLLIPAVRRNQGPIVVVCHLDSSAVYRNDPFSLVPRGIPSRRCSHVVYNSATIDPEKLVVVPQDPEYDEIKGGYKAAVGLRGRDPSLRVLISIVSPGTGGLYTDLASDSNRTDIFLGSVLSFLQKHHFDGIEINWAHAPNNRLKSLLRALYSPLKSQGYTLALVVRPEDEVDPELADQADLLFFQAWKHTPQKLALHPAPLSFATNLIGTWLKRGTNPRKIILGIPTFGRSYTLKYRNDTNAGAPVVGPGIPGRHTNFPGVWSYYEACGMIEEQWYAGRDAEGSYIKRGDQWVGYEDPISVKLKTAYIKQMGLGGVDLSTLDLDDFVGICGDPWPMLTTATTSLGLYDVPIGRCTLDGVTGDPDNCSGFLICDKGSLYKGSCGIGRFFNAITTTCSRADPALCNPGYFHTERNLHVQGFPVGYRILSNLKEKQQRQKLQMSHKGPRVVCYVTSWSLYRKGEGKFVPEHLDPRLCTDVIYAFSGLNPDNLMIQPFDPWADIDNNLYGRITSVEGPRVLLALGGWTDSTGDKYSKLVGSPSSRQRFIATTVNYLHMNNFDGLSLEWNYPKCWQSDCKKGPDSDKMNFAKLVQEIRNAFNEANPPLTLAVALSGYKEVIDRAYDVAEISLAADFISVMTYDYHGAWESKTGHLAPLYERWGDDNPYYNINFTMNYLLSLGAQREKLVPGVAFYGQAYRLASAFQHKLGDPASGPGTPGEFTKQPGMLAYYEICDNINNRKWEIGDGPSAHYKEQFVAFDDAKSVFRKGSWILENGFAGATAWTVDLDDFTNRCCQESFPLLRSLNRALGRLLDPAPTGRNCERPSEPFTPQPPTMTTHSDANDGGPRPTHSMTTSSTSKSTTWPTWTERPSKKPMTTTTWPTWTWSTAGTTTTTVRAPTRWTTTTTKKPVETEESPVPGTPCSAGEYVPDPNNCGNYLRCVLGEFRREFCTPGLHWDDKRGRCDWPAAAKCQQVTASVGTQKPISTWIPSTRPQSRPTRPTTPKPIDGPVVGPKDCEHGQYYAYPESCTHFLICVNNNLVLQQCGPGLNWNDKKSMCDWAFKNPCNDKPNKNSPLVMKDKTRNEPCIPGSFSEVPEDCASYHACLWGRHEKFSCAPGLHFNKQTHICDWPARAKCKAESEKPPVEPFNYITTSRPVKPTKNPITTTTQNWNEPWTEKPKPLPPPLINPSKVSPLSGHFKVVCYFTNWAWYRTGVGKYLPENIDHTLCTHIVYGFAVLDYSELTIRAHDSWADFDNRFYDRVVVYKQRGLKVLLALGGWNDSAGDKYSRLVNSPAARSKFIDHAVKFIEKYNFDGLDMDWEYPVCWQVECNKGPASDKEGFAALLRELSAQLKPRGLLLSSAVSPNKLVIDKGYDVPTLAKYLDWIAVMTYDYHGQWDKKTGHVAPLYHHEADDAYFFNANYSINYWISKGAPPRSIVMGMPLYGQAFSINDPSAGMGLNSPASGGTAGEFTKASGFLAYYEICDRIRNHGWKVYQDPQRRMGPYAYKGNQWVSFDDADMIRQKSQYIRDMGLGGGMVWALDLDDFRGRCGQGEHPLMHTIQQVLAEPPTSHDRPIRPPAFGESLEWLPSSPQKMPIHHQNFHKGQDEFKVVCYFTNWAWYRQEGGKYLPEDIDADLCTHVIYAFAVLDGSTGTIKPHDSWADIDNKFYERVVAYKAKGVKVLIGIGGWNDSAGDKYSRLVNSPSARARFISHVIQFIEKYGFEGLDLDWEYPVCWQVDCSKGPPSDKESFTSFVRELSDAFKPKGLLLSTAVSPSKRVIDAGYDVSELSKYFDWISVMTYDFHGQWDKKTGHVAPLYVRSDDWERTFNANFSINYWIEKGASPRKIVMGAPLYGQSFSLAERSQRGLNAPTYGGGEAGESTRARGFLAYYEICERTLKRGWTVIQDPDRRIGPYAYSGDQWVSFDDAEQIRLKAEFIKKMGLGGGMVWALDLDDFKNRCGCEPSPLLRTMNRVLRNYPPGPTCPISLPEAPTQSTVSPVTLENWPGSTSPSSSSTIDTEDTIEIEAGPPPPAAIPIGECQGRLFIPHKSDCSKYLICNFGQIQELSCPSGLHWNSDRCDWPENSKCKKNLQLVNSIESNNYLR